ncbi:MAG: methylmalonyl Co-A mutase-associated GTPase MeaB [Planctomycetota bacterium]|nr:methylmalonyl Co-A mutase-associated GTPase MeaB [Planctomycetota bacterium]MDI6787444.1 methylmalonyl Co-A mutase-associated GTPase MeaB [Planctomycetota bacterium]
MNKRLVKDILKGDKLAIARAISMVENQHSESNKLLSAIYPYSDRAKKIGVTGPPGIGKSTLVNELVIALRKQHKKVGVIAIDPSSIFSGGAILGDRIRMSACMGGSVLATDGRRPASGGQKIGIDENVFIRSMATRGVQGGLNRCAIETADILSAGGSEYIIFETVGAGQSEVEISNTADVTLVVLSPESGDSIQAMKSGLMEIANIIVVNKCDLPGADVFITNLQNTLELSRSTRLACSESLSLRDKLRESNNKTIPIIKTQANIGFGIEELLGRTLLYLEELGKSGRFQAHRQRLLRERIKSFLLWRFSNIIDTHPKISRQIQKYMEELENQPQKLRPRNYRRPTGRASPSAGDSPLRSRWSEASAAAPQNRQTPYEVAEKIIKKIFV